MLLHVVVVLFLILLGTSLLIANGRKSALPTRSTRGRVNQAAPVASCENDEGTPPNPGQLAHGFPRISFDLSRLTPAPEVPDPTRCEPTPTAAPDEILKEAEKVSAALCARASILKNVSGSMHGPAELTQLVMRDPALAGQILRTINSACYGLRQPVASVFRAILLLGHVEVRNIIWRSCVADGLRTDSEPISKTLEILWKHAFAVSRVTYALAKSLQLYDPDEISTAALLHDIGKVFYLKLRPSSSCALYDLPRFSDHEKLLEEKRQLRLGHAALGCEIVRTWGLPAGTCQMIGLHHHPSYVEPDETEGDPCAISVIYIADILCHNVTSLESPDYQGPIYLPKNGWLEMLGSREGLRPLCTDSVVHALSTLAPAYLLESASEWSEPTLRSSKAG